MEKILFIHNKAMWYRIPFFNMLSKRLDIDFIFTKEDSINGLKNKFKLLKRQGLYPLNIALGLIPELVKNKYDLVVFPPPDSPGELFDNIMCFIISKLRDKPYIIWSERWNCPEVKKTGYRKIYRALDQFIFKYICRNAAVCITSGGTKQKEYFMSFGVPDEKIFDVPYLSNIPSKTYDYTDLEKKKNKIIKEFNLENKKIILCVARLVKRKGVEYLINAFIKLNKELNDVVLFIIGGACYYGYQEYCGDDLMGLCKKEGLKDKVFFLGHINSEELPTYYYTSNLLVFPSIAENSSDTGCLPVTDAMFFGKPVISTDVVAFAHDLIKNGKNGYLVPQKSVDDLFRCIKHILSNSKLEKEMGNNSKKMIEKYFNYDKMLEGFEGAVMFASKNKDIYKSKNVKNKVSS